ncbi:MAG: histidine triad protein [Candidatus Saccharibacteria bacterium]|nr:histidine triad protein [Candidatus Saccharibacteria bacterium]
MDKTSIFTTLPEIPGRVIADNDKAFAFLTNIPITPGHTLIAPKRVVATVNELTSEEMAAMHALLLAVKVALTDYFGAEGFNYAWNEGAQFGQSVPHFHLHVVPRSTGDDGITDYEPRKYLYRPGDRDASPEEQLAALAQLLSAKIKL